MNRYLLLLCLIALTACATPSSPALPGATVPDGLGVNIHFTDAQPGEMEMLAAGGFRWVRMDFVWGATERERGHYDFSAYDRLLATLEPHHIRAVLILDYGNPLYEADSSVRTEAGRAAFAKWAAAAAQHFAGRGVLWEIWNEPNGGFWKPRADVQEYIALARATCQAIRAAAPREVIIGPATSGMDFPFLEACFQAGLLEWWDAVSVHPYRQDAPETVTADYAHLHQLLARYAPRGKTIPILSGEWGYSSAWSNVSADQQGKLLARQWLINLADHIPLSIWYDWHDDGPDPKESEHHFGTVAYEYHSQDSPVYAPKAAYRAAQTLTRELQGYEFRKRLATGRPDDYALLFGHGDHLRLVVWTTASQPRALQIPVSAGTFAVTTHTGDTAAPLEVQNQMLTITVSDAPQYLVPDRPNKLLARVPAAHPLRARLAPVSRKLMAVQVDNLDITPFRGTAALEWGETGTPPPAAQTIRFAAGETSRTLTFSLPDGAANANSEFRAGLKIRDGNIPACELPVQNFRPVSEDLFTNCHVVADGAAEVTSEQSLTVSTPPEPLFDQRIPVLQLKYQRAAGWKFFQIMPAPGADHSIPGQPHAFGCWVYSDGLRTAPRLRLTDATQQTWQPSGEEMNWKGWRYVEFPLDPATAHWGGAKDGVIHFPLHWDTLFLLDTPRETASQGTVYFTAPVVIY